jgi:hypothetical protein
MILIPTHRIIDRASLRARARSRARLPKNFKTFIPPLRPQYDHRAAPDTRSHISVGRRARGQTDFDRFARASGVTRARPLARDASRADRRADRRAIALSARARRPGAPTRAFSRARAFN